MDVSAEMDFNFTKFFGFPSGARKYRGRSNGCQDEKPSIHYDLAFFEAKRQKKAIVE